MQGRLEEWYVEGKAHTWRRKGCREEGKDRREERTTGRSEAQRGREEHREEGEPGSGWKTKGMGR